MLEVLDTAEENRRKDREATLVRLQRGFALHDGTMADRAIVSFLRTLGEHDVADAFLDTVDLRALMRGPAMLGHFNCQGEYRAPDGA